LQYVNIQSDHILLTAIKQNWSAIQFIHKPTKEMCQEALAQNPRSIQYINIQEYPELYEKYVFMVR